MDYPPLRNDGSSCWIAVIVQLLVGLRSIGLPFPGPPEFARSCRSLVESHSTANDLGYLRQRLPEWQLMQSSEGQQCAADFLASLLRTDGDIARACEFTLSSTLTRVQSARCTHEPRTMTDTDLQTELKVEVYGCHGAQSAQSLITSGMKSEDFISWTCSECARCRTHTNDVTCGDCNAHYFCKLNTLASAPRVLLVHLGRYADTGERTFGQVTLDETVTLTVDGNAVRYTLRFVIAHAGATIAQGHWLAYERFETCHRRAERKPR